MRLSVKKPIPCAPGNTMYVLLAVAPIFVCRVLTDRERSYSLDAIRDTGAKESKAVGELRTQRDYLQKQVNQP